VNAGKELARPGVEQQRRVVDQEILVEREAEAAGQAMGVWIL
jgi:hypothetical protein